MQWSEAISTNVSRKRDKRNNNSKIPRLLQLLHSFAVTYDKRSKAFAALSGGVMRDVVIFGIYTKFLLNAFLIIFTKSHELKVSYVYILTNKNNTVLYTGVTSQLQRRMFEHKTGKYKGFSKKYNCNKLVYFEEFSDINQAIKREKQIKAGSRKKKIRLIETINPDWKDLSEGFIFKA